MSSQFQHNEKLEQIKATFVERVTKFLFVMGVFGLTASLFRVLELGLLPIHLLHIAFFVPVIVVFLNRHKLSLETKVMFCILMFVSAAVAGFAQFALSSVGFMFLLTSVAMATAIYGNKSGRILAAVLFVIVALFGLAWTLGWLSLGADLNQQNTAVASWVMFAVIFLMLAYFFTDILESLLLETRVYAELVNEQKKEIEYLANHDQLTGLPNLRLALDRLDMAMKLAQRRQLKTALIYLDLDNFKVINDQHGHAAGDRVLNSVAERMLSLTRQSDTCCRIGGDEFMIVMPDVEGSTMLVDVLSRLLAQIQKPIVFEALTLEIGVSIGGAIYPDHANTIEELRKKADQMMYQVKKTGKQNFQLAD